MDVTFTDDSGRPLDAHGEIDRLGIVLHSRGGARGGPNVRNTDYAIALRLILSRLSAVGEPIAGIQVDSNRVQHLTNDQRQVLTAEEFRTRPDQAFSLTSTRMGRVGSQRATGGGNRNKRLRIAFPSHQDPDRLARLVGAVSMTQSVPTGRLPASMLEQVEADHIWHAVQDLKSGAVHPFGEATTYDLVTDDGALLPPKAVFGVAATRSLGFDIRPEHFSAGWSQPCFRILLAAGYRIEPKGKRQIDPAERMWREGEDHFVLHRKRERGSGLAAAKKAAFRRLHGRLFCERCGLDPVEHFGSNAGEACIEVHHARIEVRSMAAGHATVLDDLQCLCANCHRYVHRVAGLINE